MGDSKWWVRSKSQSESRKSHSKATQSKYNLILNAQRKKAGRTPRCLAADTQQYSCCNDANQTTQEMQMQSFEPECHSARTKTEAKSWKSNNRAQAHKKSTMSDLECLARAVKASNKNAEQKRVENKCSSIEMANYAQNDHLAVIEQRRSTRNMERDGAIKFTSLWSTRAEFEKH